jgi:hypothetical protein
MQIQPPLPPVMPAGRLPLEAAFLPASFKSDEQTQRKRQIETE